ncbi:killer cell lectin-like receptor subfamily B member 1B allele C [Ylistrum balloti]|uniref:killer cell lectin-like receptor subfamily B member 1B allele C n=1 Tax=Ylistrum balloti TaxID=509963 RepID=UPI0029058710|nr:killer cell lectin-like receptor subfamily B member 1B allele C [Ylistrum balloti]
MKSYLLLAVLILVSKYDRACCNHHHDDDDDDNIEKFEERSLTSEIVGLLNGTYFNLNEKVCQLQRRVDKIEGTTNSDNQCECNQTEIDDFRRSVSDELRTFSKILSGFENEMRLLKNEQAELREILGGDDSDASTTTTPPPVVCDSDWITSPEKCYYVSSTSQKTEWATAITRCSDMGANLVEIQTDTEAKFIMSNLPSRVGNTDIIYTGRKRNEANNWVFVSNNQIVDTNVRTWASGEPDGGTQRCGCTRQSENFRMLDCFCTGYNLFYICEIRR